MEQDFCVCPRCGRFMKCYFSYSTGGAIQLNYRCDCCSIDDTKIVYRTSIDENHMEI